MDTYDFIFFVRTRIWEKKYGSGANHVVKETGGVPAPPKGSKAKASSSATATKKSIRAATAAAAAAEIAEPVKFDLTTQRGAEHNANNSVLGPRIVRPERKVPAGAAGAGGEVGEKVHPSWEAKKKAAELLRVSLESGGKGKKIVFN